MAHVRKTITVERPVTTVYNQWTQFEEFPEFMEGVEKVTQRDDSRLKVTLDLDFEPEDAVEKVGDALGLVERRAEGDLKRFKDFIEDRGSETGAWRGRIDP